MANMASYEMCVRPAICAQTFSVRFHATGQTQGRIDTATKLVQQTLSLFLRSA